MTPLRKWIIICFVVGLCCWLVLDNLAIGSNFGRFVLSRDWQNQPLTIIRLSTLYEYVEQEDYFEGLHDPMTELVLSHHGRVPEIQAVRFEDLCETRDAWQQVLLYEIGQGREFSKMATRSKFRELQSANAWILRASAEIAIQTDWQLDTSTTYLMLLIETRLDHQFESILSAFARTLEGHGGLQIVLSERAFSLTGKRNFSPDLVLVVAIDENQSLLRWIDSIVTQSELALLNGDLDQVQAILLNPQM